MSITVWNFLIHVNGTVMRHFVLDFVSWAMGNRWSVCVVCCVVSETLVVVVDWVYVHRVSVTVVEGLSVVNVMGDLMNDVVVIEGGTGVVCWLGDDWMRVDFVGGAGNDWVDGVLLGVLVLSSVGILVVLSWSDVVDGWLSVGVLVDIDDWGVVRVMRVVRVVSWVGVNSLVVVVDSLMVDWHDFVLSEPLDIVGDGLVWHGDVPFRSVVLVVAVWAVVVVLEADSAVLILMVVSAVLDFVVSFVIDEFVPHRVVLGLPSLDMGLNLVNAGLLEWSMVRVVVWDVNSSEN